MKNELWERFEALAALSACLEGARAGRGGVVFVVGEGGLGKTSLLRAARVAAGGLDVAFARGQDMERTLSFGVLEQLARDLGMGDDLDLSHGVVEPSAAHFRVLRALRERGQGPLLVAVDDLHLADDESLSVLAFLARRMSEMAVALVCALRPWPRECWELCRGLEQDGVARVQRLAPLTPQSARFLLSSRVGASVRPAVASRAWELTGGNPLLLEQVAAALRAGEQLPEPDSRGGSLARHVLLSRFAGLHGPGLRLAQAASALGGEFRPWLPAAVADVDDSELDAALFATGVLVDKPRGMVGFAHPLFGQALYDDLDASTRRRLHARAFDVLVDRGLDAEAGEHAIRGDLAGERVVAALGRAGRASLRAGAVATAARQLEAAVSVARESASAPLRCALADALLTNGRVDEAIKLTSRALADTSLSWEERFALLRLQGRSLYLTGASDHGDEALAGAATLAEDHDAPDLAANSLLDQSLSSWLVGGPQRALPLAARARELAHRSGDGALCVRADATWGHLASESGNQEGFAATAAVSQRLWDGTLRIEASELVWPWAAVYHAAMDANYAESYQDAERIFTMAREAMEQAGAPNALATLAIYIANNVLRQGRIEDALAEAVSAREFAELTPGVIPYAEVVRAEALAWAGRLEESEAMCQAAERAAPGQWFVELWVAHVRGTRLLWQGDERAADELLVCERVTNSAGIREPCHTQWQDHAIEAYLAVDKRDDARRVIDWLEDCAKGLPCRWPRIAAATGRARLAEHEGHEDRARAEFQTALKLHDQLSLPLQHTEALLAYGIFERRSGNPTRARHPLAEALKLAERSGARWLADRAQSELALAGGRRRRDGATRDQLTAAESRVARLAGEGLSNAEIARRLHLSVNTIETHLKRVHRKLGLHSRRQLTALAATKDHGNPGR